MNFGLTTAGRGCTNTAARAIAGQAGSVGTAFTDSVCAPWRSLRGLIHAAEEQGCAAFFDYNSLQRQVGFTEADKQFREHVLSAFPPPCGKAAAAA